MIRHLTESDIAYFMSEFPEWFSAEQIRDYNDDIRKRKTATEQIEAITQQAMAEIRKEIFK